MLQLRLLSIMRVLEPAFPMNKLLIGLAFTAVATLGMTAAQAQDRRVNIINETSYVIVEFYASNVGERDWEEDILGADILEPGASVMVNVDDGTGYCKYDFMAVFDDGDEVIKEDVNVCEISSFRFTQVSVGP
jgi:hypothetical protein